MNAELINCICVFALVYLWFEMHPSYNLWGTNNPRNAQLPTKGGLGLEWILLLSSSIEGKTFPLCCRNMIGTCAFVYFCVFVSANKASKSSSSLNFARNCIRGSGRETHNWVSQSWVSQSLSHFQHQCFKFLIKWLHLGNQEAKHSWCFVVLFLKKVDDMVIFLEICYTAETYASWRKLKVLT